MPWSNEVLAQFLRQTKADKHRSNRESPCKPVNLTYVVKGDTLYIAIDLKAKSVVSKTGASRIIAGTYGYRYLPEIGLPTHYINVMLGEDLRPQRAYEYIARQGGTDGDSAAADDPSPVVKGLAETLDIWGLPSRERKLRGTSGGRDSGGDTD